VGERVIMKIGIVGNGFVGSAIVHGFILHTEQILIYDKNPDKSLHDLERVIQDSNFIFLSLPTPMYESGECDLSIIKNCLKEIQKLNLDLTDKIFIMKSTVVPGTTSALSSMFPEISFVFNPEFLTERRARLDFINSARIVLGGSKINTGKVEKLYRARFPYVKIIKTDFETAELIKYMANCFFATKISFMNEMKQISEKLGTNWEDAINGFISDGRIGNSHIDVPGHDGELGFGGKCFPKDINAIIKKAEQLGIDPKVLKATWDKNLEVRKNLDWYQIEGAVTTKEKK
jgi:UDPglucose 6-dehydrogenase